MYWDDNEARKQQIEFKLPISWELCYPLWYKSRLPRHHSQSFPSSSKWYIWILLIKRFPKVTEKYCLLFCYMFLLHYTTLPAISSLYCLHYYFLYPATHTNVVQTLLCSYNIKKPPQKRKAEIEFGTWGESFPIQIIKLAISRNSSSSSVSKSLLPTNHPTSHLLP